MSIRGQASVEGVIIVAIVLTTLSWFIPSYMRESELNDILVSIRESCISEMNELTLSGEVRGNGRFHHLEYSLRQFGDKEEITITLYFKGELDITDAEDLIKEEALDSLSRIGCERQGDMMVCRYYALRKNDIELEVLPP
ncbi:hypothetical protein DRN46_01685 [Thermococci archaeon]|nr:MAG: hypothetical protein DRN46_01685 [Thermococci archaeon]